MHIGMVAPFVSDHGVDHGLGPLCRGGAVEIGQRLAVNLLVERGEIRASCGNARGSR